MTFSAEWGGTDKQVAQNLATAQPRVLQALLQTMNAQMISLESYIKTTKLEGDPLKHRSGHLEASVQAVPATIDGDAVEGGVEGGGGLAPYGIVQELGGTFIIPEHTRRMALEAGGGRTRLLTKAGLTSSSKKINFVRTDIVVREHEAHYPERSFMRSSIDEQGPTILKALQEAAAAALAEQIGVGDASNS
jgi:hypothetical protein